MPNNIQRSQTLYEKLSKITLIGVRGSQEKRKTDFGGGEYMRSQGK
jgi:hypothetical protein